jgi:hypothetical protein
MSAATEAAKRDEAAAESEPEPELEPELEPEPDEDPDELEPEPEPEPEPVTEARIREIQRKTNAEDERHEKRLREIMGDLFEGYEPCPLCLSSGFLMPFPPGAFDPEQARAVELAMGAGESVPRKKHPTKVRCEACDGWGELDTDSRRPEYARDACLVCNGFGTVDSALQSSEGQLVTPAQWTPPPAYEPTPPPPNADGWGRPMGHPHWGVPPSQVGA